MKKTKKTMMPGVVWLAALPEPIGEIAQEEAERNPIKDPTIEVGSLSEAISSSILWSHTKGGFGLWFMLWKTVVALESKGKTGG